jgi:hypothetical protein
MREKMYYDDDFPANPKDKELNKLIHKTEKLLEKHTETRISDINAVIFGKCSTCKSFMFAEGEFTIIFAKCEWFDRPLTQKTPITNCSRYEERGSLTLYEMKQIYTPIEPPKEQVGFIKEVDKEK